MKKRSKNQNVGRISAERHLDLNCLMKEHFCEEKPTPKKKGKGKKKK